MITYRVGDGIILPQLDADIMVPFQNHKGSSFNDAPENHYKNQYDTYSHCEQNEK